MSVALAGAAITTSSVVMNAPDNLSWLWELKAASMALTGLALLLVNPDAVLAALKAKKDLEHIV